MEGIEMKTRERSILTIVLIVAVVAVPTSAVVISLNPASAQAQHAPPALVHLVGNAQGDRLAFTYDQVSSSLVLDLSAEQATQLEIWPVPWGPEPVTEIQVAVCGRYAHVMAVSDRVYLQTFELVASFGCDGEAHAVWMPAVMTGGKNPGLRSMP
jgi:hypothetical protein